MKPGPKPTCVIERIFRMCVSSDAGCVEFSGSLNSDGYGTISRLGAGGTRLVHRAVYEYFVGPVGKGLQLDHLCRNKSCCRIDHLEAVDSRTNTRRAHGWRQVGGEWFCSVGHAVVGSNVFASNNPCGSVSLSCRQCRNDYERSYKRAARNRQAARKEL